MAPMMAGSFWNVLQNILRMFLAEVVWVEDKSSRLPVISSRSQLTQGCNNGQLDGNNRAACCPPLNSTFTNATYFYLTMIWISHYPFLN